MYLRRVRLVRPAGWLLGRGRRAPGRGGRRRLRAPREGAAPGPAEARRGGAARGAGRAPVRTLTLSEVRMPARAAGPARSAGDRAAGRSGTRADARARARSAVRSRSHGLASPVLWMYTCSVGTASFSASVCQDFVFFERPSSGLQIRKEHCDECTERCDVRQMTSRYPSDIFLSVID